MTFRLILQRWFKKHVLMIDLYAKFNMKLMKQISEITH